MPAPARKSAPPRARTRQRIVDPGPEVEAEAAALAGGQPMADPFADPSKVDTSDPSMSLPDAGEFEVGEFEAEGDPFQTPEPGEFDPADAQPEAEDVEDLSTATPEEAMAAGQFGVSVQQLREIRAHARQQIEAELARTNAKLARPRKLAVLPASENGGRICGQCHPGGWDGLDAKHEGLEIDHASCPHGDWPRW